MNKIIIEGSTKPILSWAEYIEDSAMAQLKNLTMHPKTYGNILAMPDIHAGYGMPIGCVIACEEAIIPSAVGVDIGCGMRAHKLTEKNEIAKDKLIKIAETIREKIPMGTRRHGEECARSELPNPEDYGRTNVVNENYSNARRQMGTLGGGNHFIELLRNEQNELWAMTHTGSRNLGKKVGNHYSELANSICRFWGANIDQTWDLSFLHADSQDGKNYIAEYNFCTEYAICNRAKIMDTVLNILSDNKISTGTNDSLDTRHNTVRFESAWGKHCWVHRKGAIETQYGLAIIPGSQGSNSYIVAGKGKKEFLYAASHGAGRKMGRKVAMRELSIDDELKKMEDMGVVHGMTSSEDLDEAPGAYKDIKEVMEQQKDLVEIRETLKPILSIKG